MSEHQLGTPRLGTCTFNYFHSNSPHSRKKACVNWAPVAESSRADVLVSGPTPEDLKDTTDRALEALNKILAPISPLMSPEEWWEVCGVAQDTYEFAVAYARYFHEWHEEGKR